MNFLEYDLGHLMAGKIVEITLTSGANVRLLDSSNFNNYKQGRQHRYIGGLARKSPVRLQVPNSGHWYIAVDMQGLRGSTNASVKVVPGALPAINDTPLRDIPSLINNTPPSYESSQTTYDVFISHASEDKDEIVRDLAHALKSKGLEVWYDDFEMKIGDSLRKKIDQGLASSKMGLVVLSPAFFKKGWTNYELDGIVTKTNTGDQRLLPIWHNVTKQQVMDFSPSLADKVARSTGSYTVDEIATEIADLFK